MSIYLTHFYRCYKSALTVRCYHSNHLAVGFTSRAYSILLYMPQCFLSFFSSPWGKHGRFAHQRKIYICRFFNVETFLQRRTIGWLAVLHLIFTLNYLLLLGHYLKCESVSTNWFGFAIFSLKNETHDVWRRSAYHVYDVRHMTSHQWFKISMS